MGPALTAKAHAEIEGLALKMVFPRLRFSTLTTDFTPLLRSVPDLLYATGFLSYYIVQELPLFVKLLIKRISVHSSVQLVSCINTQGRLFEGAGGAGRAMSRIFKSGALTDLSFFD